MNGHFDPSCSSRGHGRGAEVKLMRKGVLCIAAAGHIKKWPMCTGISGLLANPLSLSIQLIKVPTTLKYVSLSPAGVYVPYTLDTHTNI